MTKFALNNYKTLFYFTINELFNLRMHLGQKHKFLKINLLPYIYGFRTDIDIFNLYKIFKSLRFLYKALIEIMRQRGQFFLLGSSTYMYIIELFKYFFKKYNKENKEEQYIYVTGFLGRKWIGGIFSNWKGTHQFLKYIKYSSKRNKKRYQKYLIALEGFIYTEIKFLPDFIITFNGKLIALEEINQIQIPIIGLNDSNIEPNLFLYNIISNNNNVELIQYFCNILNMIILKGKQLDQKKFFLTCFMLLKQKLYKNDSL